MAAVAETLLHPAAHELETVKVPLASLRPIARKTDYLVRKDGISASADSDPFARGKFIRDGFIYADLRLESHLLHPNGLLNGPVIPAMFGLLRHQADRDQPSVGKYKGKLGHEFRRVEDGYPVDWYVNEEGNGENYDSRYGTEHALIVIDKIVEERPDLLADFLPYVVPALQWSLWDSDQQNGWPAYVGAEFDVRRPKTPDGKPRGLRNHRWTDNEFSIVLGDGISIPQHSIVADEIVALTWAARLRWADRLETIDPALSKRSRDSALELQERFRDSFAYHDNEGGYLADALDGAENQIRSVTCNPAIVLDADYQGKSIIADDELVLDVIDRMFSRLFDERGGLRTVAQNSPVHPKNIYHGKNSIWPHIQGMAVRGIDLAAEHFKDRYPILHRQLKERALILAQAGLRPAAYYNSPVETVQLTPRGGIDLYREFDEHGRETRTSAMVQAWSGAAVEYLIEYLQAHGVSEVRVFVPNGTH